MRVVLTNYRSRDRREGRRDGAQDTIRDKPSLPLFPSPVTPTFTLPQLTLSMGLVQPPQLAGKEVRDREAASRARGHVPHTALPALQDPNPVPCNTCGPFSS